MAQSSSFTKAVIASMRKLYPEVLADKSWDNTGLLLEAPFQPHHPQKSDSVLLTIDLTKAVADEAIEGNHAIVVAYHPIIFRGLKAITLGDTQHQSLLKLAGHGISVYCPHTAVDTVPGGMADWLCDIVTGKLEGSEPEARTAEQKPQEGPPGDPKASSGSLARPPALQRTYSKPNYVPSMSTTFHPDVIGHTRSVITPAPSASIDAANAQAETGTSPFSSKNTGAGRLITFDEAQPLGILISRIAAAVGQPKAFPLAIPQGATIEDIDIKTVGLCPGSGSSVVGSAYPPPELVFTGEVSHHDALAIIERGGSIISLFHSNSERGYLDAVMRPKLEAEIKKKCKEMQVDAKNVAVEVSHWDRDPFGIVVLEGEDEFSGSPAQEPTYERDYSPEPLSLDSKSGKTAGEGPPEDQPGEKMAQPQDGNTKSEIKVDAATSNLTKVGAEPVAAKSEPTSETAKSEQEVAESAEEPPKPAEAPMPSTSKPEATSDVPGEAKVQQQANAGVEEPGSKSVEANQDKGVVPIRDDVPKAERPAGEAKNEKQSETQSDPAKDQASAGERPASPPAPSDSKVKEPPAKEVPAKEAPAKEATKNEVPADKEITPKETAKELPAEAPAKEAPAKEAPAKEAPAKEAPAKEAPAKDQSAEETAPPKEAAKEASTGEAQAQGTPIKEENTPSTETTSAKETAESKDINKSPPPVEDTASSKTDSSDQAERSVKEKAAAIDAAAKVSAKERQSTKDLPKDVSTGQENTENKPQTKIDDQSPSKNDSAMGGSAAKPAETKVNTPKTGDSGSENAKPADPKPSKPSAAESWKKIGNSNKASTDFE